MDNTTTKRHRKFTAIFKDPDLNGFSHPNDFINNCEGSDVLIYLIFQWVKNTDNQECKTYYQMYFEFLNYMSAKKIQKDYFNGLDVSIFPYVGSQEEAIKKCSDQSKCLVINHYFEYGEPRKVYNKKYSPINTENKEIPLNQKEQIIHIIQEVKRGDYKSLKDVEKDYPYLSYNKATLIQGILNRNISINKLAMKPAKVIWLYGKAGSGKTTWTNKYLRENGYNDSDIAIISPPSLVYNDMVFFTLEDQNCKALVINEVDRSFPKHNNLIAWIDRVAFLPVKGSQIRNNFELIVVNSIYKPEEVFGFLGKASSTQILRRVFNSESNSQVYKITSNDKQLKEAKELNLDKFEFQNWYQPKLELIKKPDYSLMKD